MQNPTEIGVAGRQEGFKRRREYRLLLQRAEPMTPNYPWRL